MPLKKALYHNIQKLNRIFFSLKITTKNSIRVNDILKLVDNIIFFRFFIIIIYIKYYVLLVKDQTKNYFLDHHENTMYVYIIHLKM